MPRTLFRTCDEPLPRSIHRIGGGLGLSVLALLGIGFGSILFLVLVISRHAYAFGTAVSGRLPYMSAPVYAICPVLVPVMLILAGYGVISLVVGVGMVLPLVKRREAIWTFVAVIFLWQLTGEPPRVREGILADGVGVEDQRFSNSDRQRLLAFQAMDMEMLELQIIDDLRLSNLNRALRQLEELRLRRPEIDTQDWAAGLVNLEGVAQALEW